MPFPMTAGKLVTNPYDASIGDYFAFRYVAAQGTYGTYSDMFAPAVVAAANEIPDKGTQTPNGYAYAVKTSKGKFVSDRVIQTGIPWSVLATHPNKYKRILSPNPVITGADPRILFRTQYSASGNAAYWAFLENTNYSYDYSYYSGTFNNYEYLGFDYGVPVTKYGLAMRVCTYSSGRHPGDFEIQGSNDGNNWVPIKKYSKVMWRLGEEKHFMFDTPQTFRMFRVYCTRVTDNDYYALVINKLRFLDWMCMVRMPYGGIAYATSDDKPSANTTALDRQILDSAVGTFTNTAPYQKVFDTPLNTVTLGFYLPTGTDQTINEISIKDVNGTDITQTAAMQTLNRGYWRGAGKAGLSDGNLASYCWSNLDVGDGILFVFNDTRSIKSITIWGHASRPLKEIKLFRLVSEEGARGWPLNNEFDECIRNNTLNGTVIANSDSVWHHTSIDTWCQELPSSIITTDESKRIVRSKLSANLAKVYSTADDTVGFRPVFEFWEPASKASGLWY